MHGAEVAFTGMPPESFPRDFDSCLRSSCRPAGRRSARHRCTGRSVQCRYFRLNKGTTTYYRRAVKGLAATSRSSSERRKHCPRDLRENRGKTEDSSNWRWRCSSSRHRHTRGLPHGSHRTWPLSRRPLSPPVPPAAILRGHRVRPRTVRSLPLLLRHHDRVTESDRP